ncbi:MAG: oxidoreductase, partial [Gammaproteobacteria bacterium]|nr:oxidoreductase [Gammaproteobacteria bacterium]
IAQMGFMILQCGLALFPLALLHIVAHSLYKAHAFLRASSAVEQVAAVRRAGPLTVPTPGTAALAVALALGIYLLVGWLFGVADHSPQALALGTVLVLAMTALLSQGLADAPRRHLPGRAVACTLLLSISYFTLHAGAVWLSADTLPPPPTPTASERALLVLVVASFVLAALAQSTLAIWGELTAAMALRVHLANGLYANAVFDRLLGNRAINRSH